MSALAARTTMLAARVDVPLRFMCAA